MYENFEVYNLFFFRFEFFFNPLYTKENKEKTGGLHKSLQFLYNKKFETTLLITKKEMIH